MFRIVVLKQHQHILYATLLTLNNHTTYSSYSASTVLVPRCVRVALNVNAIECYVTWCISNSKCQTKLYRNKPRISLHPG